MIAAFMTEVEITEQLRVPAHLARATFCMWRMSPSFPQPVKAMSARTPRWWFPAIVEWLNERGGDPLRPVSTMRDPGEELVNAAPKARKARGPRNTGPDLSRAPDRLAPNVVAEIGPGGKRVSRQDTPLLADKPDPAPAA